MFCRTIVFTHTLVLRVAIKEIKKDSLEIIAIKLTINIVIKLLINYFSIKINKYHLF